MLEDVGRIQVFVLTLFELGTIESLCSCQKWNIWSYEVCKASEVIFFIFFEQNVNE